jgi:hypothetical protein
LVTDFLCEAFGYSNYEELTTEYQVKGEFADYGVRLDEQLVAFIEVKRFTTRLAPSTSARSPRTPRTRASSGCGPAKGGVGRCTTLPVGRRSKST